MERFSCKMAIAPTASISIICGGTSACIEPIPANIYTHKTLSGSFSIKNPYLEKMLQEKSKDFDRGVELDPRAAAARSSTSTSSRRRRRTAYKTSFEIDQRWLLEFAADRAPYIDQAQSLNLFIPADVDKWDLMMLHFQAWERASSRSTTCAARACSAPGSPAGSRPTTPPKRQDRAGPDRLRGMPRLPVGVRACQVFEWKGYRFHFFADEGDPREPIHIMWQSLAPKPSSGCRPMSDWHTIGASTHAPSGFYKASSKSIVMRSRSVECIFDNDG